jgi:transcriptional regulator with XRE-family HTH domain
VTATGTIPEKAPLSVLLFHAAMTSGKSISDFAEQLEVGAISLRQFIEGNTQRPRTKTLELIGGALELPIEEVRRHMSYNPGATASFGDWLESHMRSSGYSRAKLTRETQISDGALRNYLSNKTRPDADQAMKLAEVLQADPYEVAQVIVASTVAENGGALAQPDEHDTALAALEGSASEPTFMAAGSADGAASALTLGAAGSSTDESALLGLWRQLHPQGRRATFGYIAMLLAER